MERTRELHLKQSEHAGDTIVYIMSRDQRVQDNHALLAAQKKALDRQLPLVVIFDLLTNIPHRSHEHFIFMLDGLKGVQEKLASLNIPFIITCNTTDVSLDTTLKLLNPECIYFDFSPLQWSRNKAKSIAKRSDASIVIVDTHNIIPTWIASDKQEYAAHTFRRKVHKHLNTYLIEPEAVVRHPYTPPAVPSLHFEDTLACIDRYPRCGITISFPSGEDAARRHLTEFIESKLDTYALQRNNIANDYQSDLSPYLHFGQLSGLRVALEVLYATNTPPLLLQYPKMASPGDTPSLEDGMNVLLEELIVRKELADNFCFYAESYTDYSSIPQWAKNTLEDHRNDPREYVYTLEEFRNATTHDALWNAAQTELTTKGKMHGYMRMYWGKKILEWTETPEQAHSIAIELNDTYSIDGGDPNGYVGILWSIAGLHDRPWFNRPVYGAVRYMNSNGLSRKFNTEAYVERVTHSYGRTR